MSVRSFYRDWTRERVRLEREALATYFADRGIKPRRLEEGEALEALKDVPSVFALMEREWKGFMRPAWASAAWGAK